MILSPAPGHSPSLPYIEGGLTLLAFAIPFCWASIGSGFFRKIEQAFSNLARRHALAVVVVGLSDFFLRLAILPILPVPKPFVPDDFSFLLAADTFASGRLTNPTPAMWTHFESIHITMQPTYMSMYFPAQGLVLAAGKVLFGCPWLGVLISSALMCAAICWMLQAWIPSRWALLGGLIAVMRLGLFSYWTNTYEAGGAIAALGGALVLGAFPRLIKHVRHRDALLLATGIVLVALSRPYEGMLLCLPVLVLLVRWIFFGKPYLGKASFGHGRPAPGPIMRRAALPLAMIIAAGAWMAYYDYRAFGSPTTMPYTVDRETYAMAPYYVWQKARPEPHYRHREMRRFYYENERDALNLIDTPGGLALQTFIKLVRGVLFFTGLALLPPFLMTRRVFMDKRVRFLVIGVLVLMAGLSIEIFMLAHYLAPFTAAFYALGLQAMRHLWVWRPGDKPVGKAIVRMLVSVCVLLCAVRVATGPLHIEIAQYPAVGWSDHWFGPQPFGKPRADVVAQLDAMPGKQLVIVRYSATHNPLDEWVYNAADIDASKVVWSREMDTQANQEIIHHYPDRTVLLVEPDSNPIKIEPYSVPSQQAAVAR